MTGIKIIREYEYEVRPNSFIWDNPELGSAFFPPKLEIKNLKKNDRNKKNKNKKRK